jgi:hypothetical protein
LKKNLLFAFIVGYISMLFSPPLLANEAPELLEIQTTPIPVTNHWIYLPKRNGVLSINVKAEHVDSVKVWIKLSPKNKRLIGEDKNGENGWNVLWHYYETPLNAELCISAHNGEEQDETCVRVTNM